MPPRSRRTVLGALQVLLATIAIAAAGRAEDTGPGASNAVFEVVLDGPAAPYPYGHVEYHVTVYDGARPDAPPSVTTLATAVEQGAAVSLPKSLRIEIPADRLERAASPLVSAVVVVGRRPAYVSKVPTALARNGATRIGIAAID